MDTPREPLPDPEERGEQNELGYYNADEDATYTESPGTQGESTGVEAEERLARGDESDT
jgi:hypothetical protein